MAKSRPDDPLLTLNLARLLLADGRLEEAIAEFRRLAGQNGDETIWEQAGNVLVIAEQYELARIFLERAIASRPAARLDLAIALLETAGPAEALRILEPIPESADAGDFLLCKARILDRAGRAEEARKLLTIGLARVPMRPTVIRQAVVLLLRDRRYQEAIELLDRAILTSQGDSDLLLLRAIASALDGQTGPAAQQLQRVESRWPEWDRPYIAHGLLLASKKMPREAARKAQTAAALRSEDPAVGCLLGRARCEPCAIDLREWIVAPCARPK
jgi:tetratricopeptide (TPR) repeat protein